ncbi:MFS transporter [Xanthobacter versatilis]|uniref:MFS transporter n=1 Tax=Xanthobacter autotrophicus (strain ATCC BAA-1158 / Py2) TaxID=78245 RepID=UPI00372BF494
MRTSTETWFGRAALMVAHCAGMLDLVALPVWVGTLIGDYKFDPAYAGGLVTLFLISAVLSSILFAPRFNRIPTRPTAAISYALAALAFFGATLTRDFVILAVLHVVAGAATGCGLSQAHGTIGRAANPHRLFAIVGMALGVFAIVFLGATPQVIAAFGGAALFQVFAGVMAVSAIVAWIAFPPASARSADALSSASARLCPAVWFGIAGIACMALTQAMIFSFVQRIGIDRGFGGDAVSGVLIALGVVDLLPAPLAAVLENRLSARAVLLAGPFAQAVLALVICLSSSFAAYAVPTAVFAAVMIFTHTFAFGILSRLDPTSRALAATPAMLMTGAAMGPIMGGILVQTLGYGGLGVAAMIVAFVAMVLFSRVHAAPRAVLAAPPAQA